MTKKDVLKKLRKLSNYLVDKAEMYSARAGKEAEEGSWGAADMDSGIMIGTAEARVEIDALIKELEDDWDDMASN
jgi:hypothetical protein